MYVYEHILAKHYSWSLEAIRDLDVHDFFMHLRICMIHENLDKEFSARLAGAEIKSDDFEEEIVNTNAEATSPQDFGLPTKREQRGTIHQQKTNKLLKFKSKVRRVKVSPDKIKHVGPEDWKRLKGE